jgi:hypothetical protein
MDLALKLFILFLKIDCVIINLSVAIRVLISRAKIRVLYSSIARILDCSLENSESCRKLAIVALGR